MEHKSDYCIVTKCHAKGPLQWRRGRGGGKAMSPLLLRPVGNNVVGIFVVKHGKKCYGNRVKCYESNCNVIVLKIFLPKSCRRGGWREKLKLLLSGKFFVGKRLPLPPPPKKKHGSHGATSPLFDLYMAIVASYNAI